MSYLKGLSNSVRSQGGFKKWPISDVDPLTTGHHTSTEGTGSPIALNMRTLKLYMINRIQGKPDNFFRVLDHEPPPANLKK